MWRFERVGNLSHKWYPGSESQFLWQGTESELAFTLRNTRNELKQVHDCVTVGRDETEARALRIFTSLRRMALAAFSCR